MIRAGWVPPHGYVLSHWCFGFHWYRAIKHLMVLGLYVTVSK